MTMNEQPKPIEPEPDTASPIKLTDEQWQAALKGVKDLQDQGVLDNRSDESDQKGS